MAPERSVVGGPLSQGLVLFLSILAHHSGEPGLSPPTDDGFVLQTQHANARMVGQPE